jgi:hypothetical protein
MFHQYHLYSNQTINTGASTEQIVIFYSFRGLYTITKYRPSLIRFVRMDFSEQYHIKGEV